MNLKPKALRTDCFSFISVKKDGCYCLKVRDCEHCKTYKSRDQVEAEQKMVREKLMKKPYLERLALVEKYSILEQLKIV